MKIGLWVRAVPLVLAAFLSACGTSGVRGASGGGGSARFRAEPAPAASAYPGKVYGDANAYKVDVARQILQANSDLTFEGQLPPMLPAIVVLRVSVDRNGRLKQVFVQRSRDDEASAVALAAVRRAGVLPKPGNLVHARLDALEFSETFLFNHDYHFQIRSLAGPQ